MQVGALDDHTSQVLVGSRYEHVPCIKFCGTSVDVVGAATKFM